MASCKGKQASRGYEYRSPAHEAYRKSFEPRDAPGFQNEYSDAVWTPIQDFTIRPSRKPSPACLRHAKHTGENTMTESYAAWLGIDWADERHRWAMQVAGAASL